MGEIDNESDIVTVHLENTVYKYEIVVLVFPSDVY